MSLLPEIDGSTQLYGLIGSPVNHSLSPFIHNSSFHYLSLNYRYVAFDVAPSSLAEAMLGIYALGVGGLNVTVPHKESIIPLLNDVTAEALDVGAVNTVVNSHGKLIGYNTDIKGFEDLVAPYSDALKGKKILIFGAGGSARAVLHGLMTVCKPSEILICNRTTERAERLIKALQKINSRITLKSVLRDDVHPTDFACVINTTSVGLQSDESIVPAGFFSSGQIAFDLIYNPYETLFLKNARNNGAIAVNGLDMLIAQAAESFRLWTNMEMPVDFIRKELQYKINPPSPSPMIA